MVAILGGRGMLGSDLASVCSAAGFEVKIHDLPDFDVTDPDHVRTALAGVDAAVNCAAYTNVDGAESQTDLAFKVNGLAVGQLGRMAKEAGVWVLHISTDFVFDGTLDRPYHEEDPPNPISAYGRGKLEGERLLVQSGCPCCIVRVEWTYGRHGKNFVTKLLERARTGSDLTVVDDQVGSPTSTSEAIPTNES